MPEYSSFAENPDDLTVQDGAVGSNQYLDQKDIEVIDPGDSSDLAKQLLTTHPDYDDNFMKWEKYTNCYESKDMAQYIFKHGREDDSTYERRVMRGYYFNYVASIVDLFISYLFHSPITRQTDAKLFAELYQNADFAGTSYELFMESASTFSQVNGHHGILVDAPQAGPEDLLNEETRQKKGIRPYLVHILAQQIRDWELDRFGNFEWVKIEIFRPQKRFWKDGKDTSTRYFLIWSKEVWQEFSVTDDRATLEGEGENPLGVVPLVILPNEFMPRHEWFGQSAVRDIADINIGILNWSSLADEEIFERCLNVLAMPTNDSNESVQLSHGNILNFPMDAQHAPQYLTPGTSPLDLIGKHIDRAKDEIYRLAKLGGSTGLLGVREATSGIAYAYEFNETNQSLARKAVFLEQAEMEIHRLYALWMRKVFDGRIIYPREFGVEDFLLELQVLMQARSQLSSVTAVKEVEKKITARMFAHEEELRDKVAKEIDSGDAIPVGLEITESFMNVEAAAKGSASADK